MSDEMGEIKERGGNVNDREGNGDEDRKMKRGIEERKEEESRMDVEKLGRKSEPASQPGAGLKFFQIRYT